MNLEYYLIHLFWLSLGFVIHFKKDHEVWQKIHAGPTNRTQTVTGLLCGTTYKFYINALNRLGYSPDSDIMSVKTNGSSMSFTLKEHELLESKLWYLSILNT